MAPKQGVRQCYRTRRATLDRSFYSLASAARILSGACRRAGEGGAPQAPLGVGADPKAERSEASSHTHTQTHTHQACEGVRKLQVQTATVDPFDSADSLPLDEKLLHMQRSTSWHPRKLWR